MLDNHHMDRRGFGGCLAASSSAAAMLFTVPVDSTADDEPPVAPKDDVKPSAVPELPPNDEVLLLTYITQRYPSSHYDDAALQGIYRDIRADLARSRILSEFPLKNSDEPCLVFRAFRNPESP